MRKIRYMFFLIFILPTSPSTWKVSSFVFAGNFSNNNSQSNNNSKSNTHQQYNDMYKHET